MYKFSNNLSREKFINVIIFFASHTQYCGKIKLFKLLYLLDFEHFRQTGKSVTGKVYEAWKFGPVPTELMEEWEDLGSDLAKAVHIVEEKVIDHDRQAVKVNNGVHFDEDFFTPRQLRILEALSEKYGDTYAHQLIDVTHEQNGAWDKVWQQGRGSHQPIPYELALNEEEPNRSLLLQIESEQRMYQAALNNSRIAATQDASDY